jgi:hypothetical protein
MREVARYAFSAPIAELADASGAWVSVCRMVDRWIASKGTRREHDAGIQIEFGDGRVADLSTIEMSCSSGNAISWTLEEPTEGGVFKTGIALGRSADVIAVACELDAGAPVQVVAPVVFEARCPQVLRDIIESEIPWSTRETRLSTRPLRFTGDQGGTDLSDLIISEVRSLPLVIVSAFEGLVLHPGIAEGMARDLAGLAIVATAADSASWVVTRTLGIDWSCYNGALRLYWPFRAMDRSPFRHPLWTSRRLLYGVDDTEQAARRIRTQLRRKILGLSTLTIRRHPIFDEIERGHRAQAADVRRKEAASQGELLKLLEGDNDRLEDENRKLQDRVARLEADFANAQAMVSWAAKDDGEEVLPDEDVPPSTVAEAVAKARTRYARLLVFGDDVAGGIEPLAENAGPPEKILGYLVALADLAETLQKGPLGATIVQWLKDRGFHVSGESETIKNSRAEMKQRTWHDGRRRREFDLHLKPTDATSPDRCVRIYFDWNADEKKVVVGWLGRKPGT